MYEEKLRLCYKMTKFSSITHVEAKAKGTVAAVARARMTMSTSKKHSPIVFDLSNDQDVNQDYHLVSRQDIWKMDNETVKKRIDELNMRVVFARKFYKGKYDERHKKWMQTLVKPMKSHHRINLSLDALIAIDNIKS